MVLWISRASIGAALGFLAVCLVCFAAGLRVNTTKSIPVGIYRLTDVPVGKGEYVIFCPPQTALFDEARSRGYIGPGFCPGSHGYMMKQVAGVAGDVVASTDEGIAVNGTLLLASVPKKADSAGRVLPRYTFSGYTLKGPELLLMSDVSGTSFDDRHFGPVNAGQIRGVIKPLVTF
ncbi:conjugative transfer signal peptidase TraF [Nitrosospira multiformis]|uniref:Conjugative transfer signal peptidase TraF n=1 Tax=Nitrosospira multiformis TaxID=1231 RepID=A0A1H8Q1M3_9PROT|nr:conjugative transfer signal peptidase TraF [Nitrosospira multiformis]SEO47881.1 conjugative transfer signal peptidase TraF [Nitrosospira multiformis]